MFASSTLFGSFGPRNNIFSGNIGSSYGTGASPRNISLVFVHNSNHRSIPFSIDNSISNSLDLILEGLSIPLNSQVRFFDFWTGKIWTEIDKNAPVKSANLINNQQIYVSVLNDGEWSSDNMEKENFSGDLKDAIKVKFVPKDSPVREEGCIDNFILSKKETFLDLAGKFLSLEKYKSINSDLFLSISISRQTISFDENVGSCSLIFNGVIIQYQISSYNYSSFSKQISDIMTIYQQKETTRDSDFDSQKPTNDDAEMLKKLYEKQKERQQKKKDKQFKATMLMKPTGDFLFDEFCQIFAPQVKIVFPDVKESQLQRILENYYRNIPSWMRPTFNYE
ncbi:hypothetical protein TRFO_04211 [Tritrichomonas foetus]|uniref:Uncharacterized protein n=1 Tax=Tritrichomonas foetus TaxID=1144522 RepID=A0A1J4KMT1_9EUKA|nr:hypothetical protein TRFO_04211 [Tritrichomonas foetus]|eukprot:OHT10693.1 hypothetical protein TRFO_04211 [Tritrichomonas foetus]